MCAEVSLEYSVRRRCRHCLQVGGRPLEDDGRHPDGFRSHFVSAENTETMPLRTLNQVLPTSPLVVETEGHRYMQTMQVLCQGGHINASADIMSEIKRRIQLARACYDPSGGNCTTCRTPCSHYRCTTGKNRGGGDRAERVCDLDSRPGNLP